MSHPILLLVPSQDRQASIRLLNSRLRPEWLADDWNRHFLADNRYWQLATHVGTGPLLVGFAITFWATLATIFSGLTGLVWEAATLRLLANDPVVAAIKAYEADNETPSLSLDALVPAYLPAKPDLAWKKWIVS